MECPYFAGVFMKYCVAEREVYVPSVYEMREQCKHPLHRVCRYYMRTEIGQAKTGVAIVSHDNARAIEARDREAPGSGRGRNAP